MQEEGWVGGWFPSLCSLTYFERTLAHKNHNDIYTVINAYLYRINQQTGRMRTFLARFALGLIICLVPCTLAAVGFPYTVYCSFMQ